MSFMGNVTKFKRAEVKIINKDSGEYIINVKYRGKQYSKTISDFQNLKALKKNSLWILFNRMIRKDYGELKRDAFNREIAFPITIEISKIEEPSKPVKTETQSVKTEKGPTATLKQLEEFGLVKSAAALKKAIEDEDITKVESTRIAGYLIELVKALQFSEEGKKRFDQDHSYVTGKPHKKIDYAKFGKSWRRQKTFFTKRGVPDFMSAKHIKMYFTLRCQGDKNKFPKSYRDRYGAKKLGIPQRLRFTNKERKDYIRELKKGSKPKKRK
uniref:Uncharacterized protein n=1 Tax=uncultured marine group II/III euryarchaeote KM3_195_B08 TaxID=1457970 RepID=A0A075GSK7_9EURY|nr:hypothetical protein [uncultured marine group II/III euryarchaeote KM3_195_B08]